MGIFNSNTPVTLEIFQNAVNSARCCAVRKGSKLLTDVEIGCCTEDEKNIETMLNLIDSIKCIVPEGVVIGGTQASVSITFTLVTSGKTIAIHVNNPPGTSTLASYVILSPTSNTTDFAAYAASFINAMYPQNYPYTATSSGNVLTIYGTTYELDNLSFLNYTWTVGEFTFSSTNILTGGTPVEYQGKNAITNNDLQIILTKLCTLCKK